MPRHLAAVKIRGDRPVVSAAYRGIGQVFDVVAHGQHDLAGDQPLFQQVERKLAGHFLRDQPRFVKGVGALQHLPRAKAVRGGAVGLDVRHGARLPAPCVVDQELGVYAEQPVQQVLVVKVVRFAERAPCDVAHGEQPVGLQLSGVSPPDPPEVGQRAVGPQQAAVGRFGEPGDPHPMPVGTHMLGDNVHRHLAQVQVAPNAGGGGDAGRVQHVEDHLLGQLARGDAVGVQIGRDVHENLVDRVNVDVLRRDVLQVDVVDARAVFDVVCHARRRGDIGGRQRGRGRELGGVVRFAGKGMAGGVHAPHGVDLFDALHHLEQPRAARDAIGLERGRHGKADGLFRAAGVCNDKVGGKRVQPALDALHRGVKGFQVDCDIGAFGHGGRSLLTVLSKYEHLFDK